MAENEEEAIWWHQAEEAKNYIKQLKGSIKKSKEEIKLSARVIQQKFIKGAKVNIKEKQLTLKVQKAFLALCETKIKR